MRRPNPILALLAILGCVVQVHASAFEPAGPSDQQIKWTTRTIKISLSTSLEAPAVSIAPDSDVTGAVERALNTWSAVSNIRFVVVPSKLQSISPAGKGDGINLITVAPTRENLAIFGDENHAARTRVFYDPATGEINEADIAINPFPYGADGLPLQFSTDGTPGTYDLESTLVHEVGHLMGLSHSQVIAATMQPAQGLNGIYGMSAITERTLSASDQVAIRSLYGPCENAGSVEGRIQISVQGTLLPAAGAHLWIEELNSGTVVAGTLTTSNGRYSLQCIPAGDYRATVEYADGPTVEPRENKLALKQRAFRSVEMSNQLQVSAEKTASLNYILVPPQNSSPALNPRLLGTNAELSTVPLPAAAGTKLTVYVGGNGVDQVPGTGLTVSSPFITVDAASLTLQIFGDAGTVISFDVTLAADVPAGDYSIKLQSNSGETAYLVGGITVPVKSDLSLTRRK